MNQKSYVDLHVHTTYSDGTFSPEEVVRYAHKAGLAAISITDHDITDGIPFAMKEAEPLGIEVVPGIELSTEFAGDTNQKNEMHILGYYLDWTNAELQESLLKFRKARQQRAVAITEKLSKLGIHLDKDHLQRVAGIGAIGRLHFAKVLIEEGIVNNVGDAFHRFLGFGRPAFVPKMMLTPEDGIGLILKARGIPVLAHPHYGHFNNRDLLNRLVEAGLKGLEVWHSKHPAWAVKNFTELAADLRLIATGGSDCHGQFGDEPAALGTIKVPYSVIGDLKKCKSRIDAKA